MSSLLESVNAEPNKIEVTNQLPIRVGDVSIITVEEAFEALANSNSDNNDRHHADPDYGYETSKYYVYGIVGLNGINSTIENLQAVGLDWYKQFNKPNDKAQTFESNGKTIFGGPLCGISCVNNSNYNLYWYYWIRCADFTYDPRFWNGRVNKPVYIAIVRVRE